MSETPSSPEPNKFNKALQWSRDFLKDSVDFIKKYPGIPATTLALAIASGHSIGTSILNPEHAQFLLIPTVINIAIMDHISKESSTKLEL